jgi:hypothetical protein
MPGAHLPSPTSRQLLPMRWSPARLTATGLQGGCTSDVKMHDTSMHCYGCVPSMPCRCACACCTACRTAAGTWPHAPPLATHWGWQPHQREGCRSRPLPAPAPRMRRLQVGVVHRFKCHLRFCTGLVCLVLLLVSGAPSEPPQGCMWRWCYAISCGVLVVSNKWVCFRCCPHSMLPPCPCSPDTPCHQVWHRGPQGPGMPWVQLRRWPACGCLRASGCVVRGCRGLHRKECKVRCIV